MTTLSVSRRHLASVTAGVQVDDYALSAAEDAGVHLTLPGVVLLRADVTAHSVTLATG